MKLVEGRLPSKTEEFTNEEVVGFKLPLQSTTWDTPRRGKSKLCYNKQKVITCMMWMLRKRWLENHNLKRGYKHKYESHQYYDFISYFMSLVIIKILKDESVFSMPYGLGKLKLIKFKSTYIDQYGKIHLNLHSFRMKYKFLWTFGSIKSFRLYKFSKVTTIKWSLFRKLLYNGNCYDSFFYFISSPKRHGAWVNAPDRDLEKLYEILKKHYGENIYNTHTAGLDRRQRFRARKPFKKSIKKVGD
jgi:hypothetical protein